MLVTAFEHAHSDHVLQYCSTFGNSGLACGIEAIAEVFPQTRIHVDLQHQKETVRRHRSSFMSSNGANLTEYIVDVLLASAEWPTDVEFNTCWDYVLKRLEDPNDLALSSQGIQYLRKEVLRTEDDGPKWRGGLAATQVGYSPFVSNAEERSWRSLKELFPAGYRSQDAAQLLEETCGVLKAWSENGQLRMKKLGQRLSIASSCVHVFDGERPLRWQGFSHLGHSILMNAFGGLAHQGQEDQLQQLLKAGRIMSQRIPQHEDVQWGDIKMNLVGLPHRYIFHRLNH